MGGAPHSLIVRAERLPHCRGHAAAVGGGRWAGAAVSIAGEGPAGAPAGWPLAAAPAPVS
jgi:hypothetical protein